MDKITEILTTADLMALSMWMLAGITIGILATFIVTVILRMLSHKHEIIRLAIARVRTSAYVFMAFMGAGLGFEYALEDLRNLPRPPKWVLTSEHILLICVILSATWMCVRLVGVVEDIARHFSHDSKGGRGMRVVTQAQILSRIVQAIVIICGVSGVVLTFPQARLIAGSILASAGVLSIVAGMAAQSSLSNMFAGIQIAISDSLRVGDIVVVNNNGLPTQATIEEITLTYIVVRIWDDRRIIIPSINFTQNSFENWTRRAASLMGTVEIEVDWSVSVTSFRRQVDKLLTSTDLWDGRSFNVQVTNVVDNKLTIRVSVSANNAGDLWDLRCYLREHLIEWIKTEQPHAIPRTNIVVNNTHQLASTTDMPTNTQIVQDENTIEVEEKFLVDTSEKAKRIAASENVIEQQVENAKNEDKDKEDKKNKVKRKSVKDKTKQEKAEQARVADLEETQVMTASQIKNEFISLAEIKSSLEEEEAEVSLAMERLYSGSPENEERAKIFFGPGAEVIEEREKTAQLHSREIDDTEDDNTETKTRILGREKAKQKDQKEQTETEEEYQI